MIIRSLNIDNDLKAIDRIWKEGYSSDFSLPDLSNAVTFAVVEDAGEIVGFGMVKMFAEAIMILDKSKSIRVKSETMKLLLDKAETDCRTENIKQLHSFTNDPNFANLLVKHFNFKTIQNIGLQKEL